MIQIHRSLIRTESYTLSFVAESWQMVFLKTRNSAVILSQQSFLLQLPYFAEV